MYFRRGGAAATALLVLVAVLCTALYFITGHMVPYLQYLPFPIQATGPYGPTNDNPMNTKSDSSPSNQIPVTSNVPLAPQPYSFFKVDNLHSWVERSPNGRSVTAFVISNSGTMAADIDSISLRGINSSTAEWYSCSTCATQTNIATSLPPNFSPSSGVSFTSGIVLLSNGKFSVGAKSSVIVYIMNAGNVTPADAGNTYTLEVHGTNEIDTEQVQVLSYLVQSNLPPPSLEELKQYALKLINQDRANAGLNPVVLSGNPASQLQSADIIGTMQISHWMTNGDKPYMSYSRYGGLGAVSQNAAVWCYSQRNPLSDIGQIESNRLCAPSIMQTIATEEYQMMNDDLTCCNNGHRNDILDPHHTSVSIGIAYNNITVAMIQNFENNYLALNTPISPDGKAVSIQGAYLHQNSGYLISGISIYYDAYPSHATYVANAQKHSYDAGELLQSIVKPAPPGFSYQQPSGYLLTEASSWSDDGSYFNVRFNISPAIAEKGSGVYTIYVFLSNNGSSNNAFPVTSYSIFIAG